MTACIVAICEGGKYIVIAADRMYTSPLNVEFETQETKIEVLGKICVALASGNSAHATEVLDPIQQLHDGEIHVNISDLAEEVKNQYMVARLAEVEDLIVLPSMGKDFLDFRDKGGALPNYLQTQPTVYSQIVVQSSAHNYSLDLLLAGIDDTGAYIYHIGNPGLLSPLDKLGHAAIGSGGIHAIISLSLGGQTRHRNLIETLYSVYLAKICSEVAPGVGNETDMAVVDEEGIRNCSPEFLESLRDICGKSQTHEIPNLDDLRKKYDEK